MHYGIQTLKLGSSSLWLFLAKYVCGVCWYWTSTKWINARPIKFAIPMFIPMHIPGLNLYTRPTLVPTYLVSLFLYLPIDIPSYLGFQLTYLFAYLDYLPSYVGPNEPTYLLAYLDYLISYHGPQLTNSRTHLPWLPNFQLGYLNVWVMYSPKLPTYWNHQPISKGKSTT